MNTNDGQLPPQLFQPTPIATAMGVGIHPRPVFLPINPSEISAFNSHLRDYMFASMINCWLFFSMI